MFPAEVAATIPAFEQIVQQADKLSAQLGGIERMLRVIVAENESADPIYNNSTSNVLEASRIVKAGAGRLYGFSGYNTNAGSQYILGFDTDKVPPNGTAPKFVMQAQPTSAFWVSWTPNWRPFRDGWVLCNSSTLATLTIGGADCWFDAQYG